MQGRGRNTGAENGHVNTEGEDKEKGELRVRIDMYTLPRVKWLASGDLLYSKRSSAQLGAL